MRPRVLLVASEAIPFIKTGGLADVISAMSAALASQQVDVTLLMPGYPSALAHTGQLSLLAKIDDLPGGPGRLLQGAVADSEVKVLLLDTEHFRHRTGNPYVDASGAEYAGNGQAFAALAHAAVHVCAGRTGYPVPDVVHANDWHAALIPLLLRLAGVSGVGSVLTIHNLAFQGLYPLELGRELGIPQGMLGADGVEFWGKLNFLKAGIRHADRLSIVSKSYAREVLTPAFGCGLEDALKERAEAIVAIPNGIDVDTWNPAGDALIPHRFSAQDMRNKQACKRHLLAMYGLIGDVDAPLLALGSRITHQKMADVALDALPLLLEKHAGLRILVLGRGDHAYEEGFTQLARAFPGRAGVHIGYDEARAHALHAGADMLLHGTRFEPFGLTPIYAMRYGTIPIASRVGGLMDTITDAGTLVDPRAGGNGILFDGDSASAMCAAVDRGLALFDDKELWAMLQRHAMTGDFSWMQPVRSYIELYRDIAGPASREAFNRSLHTVVAVPQNAILEIVAPMEAAQPMTASG